MATASRTTRTPSANTATVIGRTFSYAGLATIALHRARLPAGVLHRHEGRPSARTCCWRWWCCRSSPRTSSAPSPGDRCSHDGGPIVGVLRSLCARPWASNERPCSVPTSAVVGALTYNFLPFMVLPIYVSLEKVDKRLLEAGPDLYATGGARSARSRCRCRCPGCSPAACSRSSRPPATSSTRVARQRTPDDDRQRHREELPKAFFRPELSALSFVLMALILVGVLMYASCSARRISYDHHLEHPRAAVVVGLERLGRTRVAVPVRPRSSVIVIFSFNQPQGLAQLRVEQVHARRLDRPVQVPGAPTRLRRVDEGRLDRGHADRRRARHGHGRWRW